MVMYTDRCGSQVDKDIVLSTNNTVLFFSSSKALRIANSANAGRFVVVCSSGYNQSSNWYVYSK